MKNNLKQVFVKMFSYSPYEFSEKFIKKSDWFREYSWSKGEEEEFKKWLIKYLVKNWKGVVAVHTQPNKRIREKAANEFIFNYGWKIKTEITELTDESVRKLLNRFG